MTELDRAYSVMRCLLPRSQNFEVLKSSVEDMLKRQFAEAFLTDLQEHGVAAQDFDRALSKAFWRRVLSRLTGETNALLPFDEPSTSVTVEGS